MHRDRTACLAARHARGTCSPREVAALAAMAWRRSADAKHAHGGFLAALTARCKRPLRVRRAWVPRRLSGGAHGAHPVHADAHVAVAHGDAGGCAHRSALRYVRGRDVRRRGEGQAIPARELDCGGVGGTGQSSIGGGKGLLRTLVVALSGGCCRQRGRGRAGWRGQARARPASRAGRTPPRAGRGAAPHPGDWHRAAGSSAGAWARKAPIAAPAVAALCEPGLEVFLDAAIEHALARTARRVSPRCTLPGLARAVHAGPLVERGGSRVGGTWCRWPLAAGTRPRG